MDLVEHPGIEGTLDEVAPLSVGWGLGNRPFHAKVKVEQQFCKSTPDLHFVDTGWGCTVIYNQHRGSTICILLCPENLRSMCPSDIPRGTRVGH